MTRGYRALAAALGLRPAHRRGQFIADLKRAIVHLVDDGIMALKSSRSTRGERWPGERVAQVADRGGLADAGLAGEDRDAGLDGQPAEDMLEAEVVVAALVEGRAPPWGVGGGGGQNVREGSCRVLLGLEGLHALKRNCGISSCIPGPKSGFAPEPEVGAQCVSSARCQRPRAAPYSTGWRSNESCLAPNPLHPTNLCHVLSSRLFQCAPR